MNFAQQPGGNENDLCSHLEISGKVTGVGYRYWFAKQARRLHLRGWVRNASRTRVEAVVCGTPWAVEQIGLLAREGPRLASPSSVIVTETFGETHAEFNILR